MELAMGTSFPRAIIVGASSGVGAALARALGAQGAAVGLVARRQDRLDALKSEVEALGGRGVVVCHDVTEYDAAPALFDGLVETLLQHLALGRQGFGTQEVQWQIVADADVVVDRNEVKSVLRVDCCET